MRASSPPPRCCLHLFVVVCVLLSLGVPKNVVWSISTKSQFVFDNKIGCCQSRVRSRSLFLTAAAAGPCGLLASAAVADVAAAAAAAAAAPCSRICYEPMSAGNRLAHNLGLSIRFNNHNSHLLTGISHTCRPKRPPPLHQLKSTQQPKRALQVL